MTKQIFLTANSKKLPIKDKSIQLIVTSPPYPMIEMWDSVFMAQNPKIKNAIETNDGEKAFKYMHNILDKIWEECDRVLMDNGFICINIGDATRTINGKFQLYSNHTQIINKFLKMGYSVLPDIQWKKTSNAPNKFMGSGMYPAGAYVTYEHEYILIFRKGGKRNFSNEEKILRQESAYFWEERNLWFSDIWEINGTSQKLEAKTRIRNASFPIEIPYRLINMYSIKGDNILDPFGGLGNTLIASIITERNCYSVDINDEINQIAKNRIIEIKTIANNYISQRIHNHKQFIESLPIEKQKKCYQNEKLNILVKTQQEKNINIHLIKNISLNKEYNFAINYYKDNVDKYTVSYENFI